MKKLLIFLCLTIMALSLAGCSSCEEYTVECVVVNKHIEQSYNVGSSWLWDNPVYSTDYYLYLEYDGEIIEQSVTREEYNTYNIGDIYLKTMWRTRGDNGED